VRPIVLASACKRGIPDEVGYDVDELGRIVVVHAMPARKKYL
jgi:hypothetical protein